MSYLGSKIWKKTKGYEVSDMLFVIFVYGTMLLAAILIWVGTSHFEAKTYNKLTGADVSTFDAMFVQLRVVEPLNLKELK